MPMNTSISAERLAAYRTTFGSLSTPELRAIVEGRKPHEFMEALGKRIDASVTLSQGRIREFLVFMDRCRRHRVSFWGQLRNQRADQSSFWSAALRASMLAKPEGCQNWPMRLTRVWSWPHVDSMAPVPIGAPLAVNS